MTHNQSQPMTDELRQALLAKAQYFVDCKYVARADARQKAMGLAYVEAERQDLANEIANFSEGHNARLTRLCAAYKGQVEAGASQIEHLWHRIRKLEHDNNQAAERIMELEARLQRILARAAWDDSDDLKEFRRQMVHIQRIASAALPSEARTPLNPQSEELK